MVLVTACSYGISKGELGYWLKQKENGYLQSASSNNASFQAILRPEEYTVLLRNPLQSEASFSTQLEQQSIISEIEFLIDGSLNSEGFKDFLNDPELDFGMASHFKVQSNGREYNCLDVLVNKTNAVGNTLKMVLIFPKEATKNTFVLQYEDQMISKITIELAFEQELKAVPNILF